MLPQGYHKRPFLLLTEELFKTGFSLEDQKILVRHANIKVVRALAYHEHLHPDIVDLLIENDDPEVRLNLVQAERSLTLEQQMSFLEDVSGEVCNTFFAVQRLHPAVQRKALQHGDAETTILLASNPYLGEDIQEEILSHDSTWSKQQMIRNRGLCKRFHAQFITSENFRERTGIATNTSISQEHQVQLSFDENQDVLLALMENRSLKVTPAMSAYFLFEFRPEDFTRLAGEDREALEALAFTWNGSLNSLREADQLTRR